MTTTMSSTSTASDPTTGTLAKQLNKSLQLQSPSSADDKGPSEDMSCEVFTGVFEEGPASTPALFVDLKGRAPPGSADYWRFHLVQTSLYARLQGAASGPHSQSPRGYVPHSQLHAFTHIARTTHPEPEDDTFAKFRQWVDSLLRKAANTNPPAFVPYNQ
ncbi:hypothetical protein BU26DRAFT_592818 [Trematosphaeria pertusa]|uniref:Uncharacterized protein n=1 Tax=Trematosphaeria pertusa TaxID=390896 RepID=A0A6A6IMB4_9PLEO|nr:uncharacterized protein BU26DRAFT_592818 [Trematosphaeria pertusa]KAF2251556.1 hypothetical protein BU26DRAFT_592818 [Trematosphaeria pertusa]